MKALHILFWILLLANTLAAACIGLLAALGRMPLWFGLILSLLTLLCAYVAATLADRTA